MRVRTRRSAIILFILSIGGIVLPILTKDVDRFRVGYSENIAIGTFFPRSCRLEETIEFFGLLFDQVENGRVDVPIKKHVPDGCTLNFIDDQSVEEDIAS